MTDKLDHLCVRMLCVGATAEGTSHMRASEIRTLLVPFFGEERVTRCVQLLTVSSADLEVDTLKAILEEQGAYEVMMQTARWMQNVLAPHHQHERPDLTQRFSSAACELARLAHSLLI